MMTKSIKKSGKNEVIEEEFKYACAGQPPAWSRITLGKRSTFSSSNPNYIFFETASIPRSDMEKGKCNAANNDLLMCYLKGYFPRALFFLV